MKKNKLITFAFIDATNIIYGASDLGWRMDFFKLAHYLKTRFRVSKILYYAGVDNENVKQLFGAKFDDLSRLKKLLFLRQKNEADAFKGSASRDYVRTITKIKKFVKGKKQC